MMKHAVIIVYFCSPQRMDSQEATARGARLRCAPLAYPQFSRRVLRRRPRGHLGRRHPDRASWRRRLRRAGIQERDLPAVGWAIVAMTIAIILYDQLLFRPMVAWADKFRFEQTASQMVPKSAVLDLFRRSRLLKRLGEPIAQFLAAFPANLLFPVAVFFIVHFDLAPGIWLSPLTRPSRNQTG